MLPAFLSRAQRMYGHLDDAQLAQHVFTHGKHVNNNF